MQKIYSRIDWENEPSTNTPLSESNLNKMDYALDQIDDRVVQLYGYQDRVSQAEKNAKTSEINAKTSETNAKQSEVKAKEYMESAFKGTPEGYQEFLDKVDALEIKTTKENTIKGTKNGGFRFNKVVANTIQNGTPSPITPIPMLSTGDCVDLIGGWHNTSNGVFTPSDTCVSNKNPIPCKSGDVIGFITDDTCNHIALFFNDNGYVSYSVVTNTKESSFTVPSGATKFYGNFATNFATVGKITLTINGKYLGCAKTRGKNRFAFGITAKDVTTEYRKTAQIFKLSSVDNVNTVKCVFQNTEWSTGYIALDGIDGTKEYKLSYKVKENTTAYEPIFRIDTTNSNKNRLVLAIVVNNNVVIDNSNYLILSDIQIEENDVTPYEPYRETLAYFLTTYPMIKGSTLYKEDGLFKAMHTTIQQEFNGDEDVRIYELNGENVERFYINVYPPRADLEVSYCSHLPFMDGNDDIPHYRWSSSGTVDDQIMMFIPKNLASTVDEFKAWLASNPVTVMWSITPTIETLDNESQIALNGLETFDGVTHVEFDSRVQPLEFEAEVGTSQVGAYTLKSLNNSESNAVKIEDAISTMLLIGA